MFVSAGGRSAAELIIRAAEIGIMKDAFYALLAVGVAMMAAGAALSASVRYTGAFVGTGDVAAANDTGTGLILLGASAASIGVVAETGSYKKARPRLLVIAQEAHPWVADSPHYDKDSIQPLVYKESLEELEMMRRIIENDKKANPNKETSVFLELEEYRLDTYRGLSRHVKEFVEGVKEICKYENAELIPLEVPHVVNAYTETLKYDHATWGEEQDDNMLLKATAERAVDVLSKLYMQFKHAKVEPSEEDVRAATARTQDAFEAARSAYKSNFKFSDIPPINKSNIERYLVAAAHFSKVADRAIDYTGGQLEKQARYNDIEIETGALRDNRKELEKERERGFANTLLKKLDPYGTNIAIVGAKHAAGNSEMMKMLRDAKVDVDVELVGKSIYDALMSGKVRKSF
jgi:hypothetical protein